MLSPSNDLFRAERAALRRLLLIMSLPALAVALAIVFTTATNRHPDETLHLDAVRYYAEQIAPPPLNADGLIYGPDGWSRVYNGEAVYWIYGRAVAGLRLLAAGLAAVGGPDLAPQLQLPYNPLARLLNVLLLAATLAALIVAAQRNTLAAILGLTMLAMPQVIYLYAYLNSDAWGLSAVICTFLFLLTRADLLARRRDGLWLGLLLATVALSKEPFWLGLPFLLVLAAYRAWPQLAGAKRRTALEALALAALLVLALAAPLKIIYPLSQPNYAAQATATRDQRAWPGFGPSSPTEPSRQIRDKGQPFSAIAASPQWYESTARSSYGLFGHFNVGLPAWQYYLAGLAALLALGATGGVALSQRQRLSALERSLLIVAPLTIGLCLIASLRHSWTVDIQPQGRYLFGALPAFALLIGGLGPLDPRWLARLRLLGWCAMILLSLISLALVVPGNPLLS
jgi:hypothetical protein